MLKRILLSGLLLSVFVGGASAIAEEDPIMSAANDCSKEIKKDTKKALKFCKKISKTEKKIGKEEGKIDQTLSKLQTKIASNEKKRQSKIKSIKNSCEKKEEKYQKQLIENAFLQQKAQDAIIDCIGGFFGFGDGCSEKDEKNLLKLIDKEADLILKIDHLKDDCTYKENKANNQYDDKNNKEAEKTEEKVQKSQFKIDDYFIDIAGYEDEIGFLNNEILACGGAPVSCN